MEIKKLTGMLFFLNVGQILIGTLLFALLADSTVAGPAIWACIALIMVSSLVTIVGIGAAGRYQNKSFKESMQNLETLNRQLREQQHDIMNHFHVVHGLLELGDYEEARRYITPVFKEINRVRRALKTAQPAVNALLQVKMEAARQQGIVFQMEVGTNLRELSIEPWDLCRILANLLDNAMTALEGWDEKNNSSEARIWLAMREDARSYYFEIGNNGPMIPADCLEQIFRSGFSTKKGEGHGQGLAIVSRLVREAKGKVTVESDKSETVFVVELPKN